jgi:hypothetical protein
MRLKNRKYGRTEETVPGGSSTHIVKIGFDARNQGETFPRPGKYNGFVICRDRVGPDNNLIVDHAIMKRLDPTWQEAKLGQAQKPEKEGGQLKAPDNLLPKTLHFVLIGNAQKDKTGAWHYPRTFSESLEWWGKIGLCCIGNGDTAIRTDQETRVKKKIECVPVGRDGFDPKTFCPHSMPQGPKKVIDCKSHSRLMLSLYFIGADGKPEPLCRELGWNGRFRFDTASGYNPLRILTELDAAADRCEGSIHLIRGTLSFGMQRKRYDGGVSIVGQVMFSLSEEDIARREQEIHRQKMERQGRVLTSAAGLAMLGMDLPAEQTIDPDEELKTAAATAELSEPPWPQESEPGEEPQDDIPFDDVSDAAAEKGVEIRVADATPEQLVDAIVAYCDACAREEQAPFDEVFSRVTAIDTARGPFIPPNAQWFIQGPSEQAPRRFQYLRNICRELEENDIRFVVRQAPATAVPA